MSRDVRAAAASAIGDVLGGRSLDGALRRQLDKVGEADRGLLRQLCYGTLRDAPRLQPLLGSLLDKPLREKDRDLQGLLLCGLYQLDHTRIPDHAAVGATVGAARALKKDWARGMTNAVLRRYQREREALWEKLPPAAAASHPDWLFEAINAQWPGASADIIAANNEQPPMTLRVNRLKRSREDYASRLAEAGMEATAGALAPESLRLANPADVMQLPGFSEGEVSVQDEAAQLAALLLDAQPGERVLDACAAPGGKCCHILELQPQLAELVAMDVDAVRLERVADNLERLQLEATVLTGDAGQPPEALQAGSFDRILLDAPCSASGVIRRHPDAKLLRRESDIGQLAAQQLTLLEGLWPLLQPGGCLLYATCSILDQENSQVVQAFMERHDTAMLSIPDAGGGEVVSCGRQLLPTPCGYDGLFYARLQKAA